MYPILFILTSLVYYLIGSIPTAKIVELATKEPISDLVHKHLWNQIIFQWKRLLTLSLVVVFDFIKGILPLWLGFKLGLSKYELSFMVIALMLGVYFPIFSNFKGGLGTVVAIASFTTIGWSVLWVGVAIWLVAILISGYQAIANVLLALFISIYIYYFDNHYMISVAVLCSVIILRHMDVLIKIRYGYYLADFPGLYQRFSKNLDFLV